MVAHPKRWSLRHILSRSRELTKSSNEGPKTWSEPRFRLAVESVRQACRLARELQESGKELKGLKVDASPVTIADLAVQALILRSVRLSFPEDVVIAEEASSPLLRSDGLLEKLQEVLHPHVGTLSTDEILACFEERNVPASLRIWQDALSVA